MNNAKRKLALVLVALVMVLSLALTACETKHDYTVKVVGTDGKPYTTAKVQPCIVDETAPGGLGMCYPGVATDENGVAYLDIGADKEIKDTKANEIEIHLLGLPATLTYTPVRMKKGETKTITLTAVSDGPTLKTPKSGTGAGSYEAGSTIAIDLETFDPYVVVEGSYALKFTSATQKIYYAFEPFETGVYKVYSSGDIDASVAQMFGNTISGINCWHEDEYSNDNISDSDYNFCYEFDVEEGTIASGNHLYFEVALEASYDVGVDAVITFEYVSEGQGGGDDVTDVNATEILVDYADPIDDYYRMPTDGTAVYVKNNSDGFYHKDTENGEIVFADLGTDNTLNDRHIGMSNYPLGLDKSFTQIAQLAGLTLTIEGTLYNYYPLAQAYTAHSNSNGRYPLTDELIVLLNSYLTQKYTVELFKDNTGVTPPATNPWIVWCGYYQGVTALEKYDGNGGGNSHVLTTGYVTVDVPTSGTVTYTYQSDTPVKLTFSPFFTNLSNVTISVYTELQDPEGATELELKYFQDEEENKIYYYEIEIDGGLIYSFVFSTADSTAATLEFRITAESLGAAEGSEDNPIIVEYLSYYYSYDSAQTEFGEVYFSYTVTSGVTKLYFDLADNTQINIIHNGTTISSYDEDAYQDILENGLTVAEGDTVIIVASLNAPSWMVDDTWVGFTISDSPISKD